LGAIVSGGVVVEAAAVEGVLVEVFDSDVVPEQAASTNATAIKIVDRLANRVGVRLMNAIVGAAACLPNRGDR
jgi:hypothetical protein